MKEFRLNEVTWTLPEVIEALNEASDYFRNRADVSDGDYGVPSPNVEMKLASRTEDALAYIEWLRQELKGLTK